MNDWLHVLWSTGLLYVVQELHLQQCLEIFICFNQLLVLCWLLRECQVHCCGLGLAAACGFWTECVGWGSYGNSRTIWFCSGLKSLFPVLGVLGLKTDTWMKVMGQFKFSELGSTSDGQGSVSWFNYFGVGGRMLNGKSSYVIRDLLLYICCKWHWLVSYHGGWFGMMKLQDFIKDQVSQLYMWPKTLEIPVIDSPRWANGMLNS